MDDTTGADDFVTVVDRRKRVRLADSEDGKRMRPASSSEDIPTVTNDDNVLRREKVPPIIVSVGHDWQVLLKELKESAAYFEAKFVGKRLHLLCNSAISFRLVQKLLAQKKVQFHTFALKEEAELKAVVRGLPAGTPEQDVRSALEDLEFSPTVVTPLERRCRVGEEGPARSPTNTLLIRFRKTGNWAKIWELTSLLGVRVSVDQFTARPGVPQCYRCQRFYHSSAFCYQAPRCVKCGGEHEKKNCSAPEEAPPKCCNCGGGHVASWRGCPAYKRIAGSRRATRPTQAHERTQPRAPTGPLGSAGVATGKPAGVTAPRSAPACSSVQVNQRKTVASLRPEQPGDARTGSTYATAVKGDRNDADKPKRRRNRKKHNKKVCVPDRKEDEAMDAETAVVAPAASEGAPGLQQNQEPTKPPASAREPREQKLVPASVVLEVITEVTTVVLGPALPATELLAIILNALRKLIADGETA